MKTAPLLLALTALAATGCRPSGADAPGVVADAPPGLPESLKNDAFEYYGLGNDKPVRLEIVENGLPNIGTKTVRLEGIKGDKATYTLHQDGGLSGQGDITLSLEKDGIYTMKSSVGRLKAHSLEMPAKLEVGGGWKDHTEMSDGKIVLDNDLKIVGKERVSTPGGTFDEALHVTSTGGGTMGGGPIDLATESWYVRGLGAVKQILRITPKGKGAKRTVTVQLAAPEKAEGPAAGGGTDAPTAPAPPAGSGR